MGGAPQPCAIYRQAFRHPHHVVAGFVKRQVFDPVHDIHLPLARIAQFCHPPFGAAGPGVISGGHHHHIALKPFCQMRQIRGAKAGVIGRIGQHLLWVMGQAQLFGHLGRCGGHQLHQPLRAGAADNRWVKFAFTPGNGQCQFGGHSHGHVLQGMQRVIRPRQGNATACRLFADHHGQMRGRQILGHLPKLPQRRGIQPLGQMDEKLFSQRGLARVQRQNSGLKHPALGELGLAPVGVALIAAQAGIGGQTAPFGGQQPVKTGLVLPALCIGNTRRALIAQRLLRPANPIACAPQRNWRRYGAAQALKMIARQCRVAQIPQGQIPRQPF